MSDTKTDTDLPEDGTQTATPVLDPSVTELLDLLGSGGGTQTQGDTGPVPQEPTSGPQPPTPQSEYDTALEGAMPAVAAARAAAAISPLAKNAVDEMEASLNDAAVADGNDDLTTARQKLADVVRQAEEAQQAGRDDLRRRHERVVGKLGRMPDRIAAVANAPAAATQALRSATDARDVAHAAVGAETPDWQAADAAVRDFDRQVDAVVPACLNAAQTAATGFAQRFKNVNDAKSGGSAVMAKFSAYSNARKALEGRIGTGDALRALEAIEATETALSELEAAANPSDDVKQRVAQQAFDRLSRLKDRALKKMSTQEKAELALDLCANGKPTSQDGIDQLARLYKQSPPDKAFLKKREEQRQAIVDAVVQIPEISQLYNGKGKFDKNAWDTFIQDADRVRDLLANIADIQADTLGIPRVPVSKRPNPPEGRDPNGGLTFGGYSPASNTVGLNLHEDCLKPPEEAIGTILHEMFHAHQDVIVRKLKAGEIQPGDPDYPTALMYMVNDIPLGYLFDDDHPDDAIGQKNYERQPTEIDAEYQGLLAAQTILKQAAKLAKKRK